MALGLDYICRDAEGVEVARGKSIKVMIKRVELKTGVYLPASTVYRVLREGATYKGMTFAVDHQPTEYSVSSEQGVSENAIACGNGDDW